MYKIHNNRIFRTSGTMVIANFEKNLAFTENNFNYYRK